MLVRANHSYGRIGCALVGAVVPPRWVCDLVRLSLSNDRSYGGLGYVFVGAVVPPRRELQGKEKAALSYELRAVREIKSQSRGSGKGLAFCGSLLADEGFGYSRASTLPQ